MKKAAPVLAASEKKVNIAGNSILGSAGSTGTGSRSDCEPLEAAARMAEEEHPRLRPPPGA
uniref:Uncharacterized protein n=1 Tax=Arundo donax TaxID=35708 RepID=A0A0A9F5K3_ARUDO